MTIGSDNSMGIPASTMVELLALRTQVLDTTVVSLNAHEYSVIEFEDYIAIKRTDLHVDIGYLTPCIRTTDIDVYVCDVNGEIAGMGVIELIDEPLPIDVLHKRGIEFMLELQSKLTTKINRV